MRFLFTYLVLGFPVGYHCVKKNIKEIEKHKTTLNKESYDQAMNTAKMQGVFYGLVWPITVFYMWTHSDPAYIVRDVKAKVDKLTKKIDE